MSRIGRKPVPLAKGVSVTLKDGVLTGKSALGELSLRIPAGVSVDVSAEQIDVSVAEASSKARALHGTTRSLINNMVQGLQKHYVKELEIQGVGFRAAQQGQKLTLSLGFSHPIVFEVPAGITVKLPDATNIVISGADKHVVGEVAARLRSYFPAEPYKGKGVRYKGEHVRRKAGKAVA